MGNETQNILRGLPAVDVVLDDPAASDLRERYGRQALTGAVRDALDARRRDILEGKVGRAGLPADVLAEAAAILEQADRRVLRRVLNATGIILHTGLGRAVMPLAAREALAETAGCCNIQMDMRGGGRIKRETCVRDMVCELTGAEDVVLVNNNAGATLLVLAALCRGREAVVSRGELIEIGGSFRLPDVMSESGAILKEVGATNKTHPRDYERAIGPDTGLLLKVHKSNYQIRGFTKEVTVGEIVPLGKQHDIPVVDDLGCGAMVDLEKYGLGHEPTVRESLEQGTDVVLFSTDKLIGGPQGGMIVGRADLLGRIRSHPLYRALRVGKMTLTALEATLRLFRSPDLLEREHPTYRMLARTRAQMQDEADRLAGALAGVQPGWRISVVEDESHLGGGSLPGSVLPAFSVRIETETDTPDAIARRLRLHDVPVIPYIKDNAVHLNLRTLSAGDIPDVTAAAAQDA